MERRIRPGKRGRPMLFARMRGEKREVPQRTYQDDMPEAPVKKHMRGQGTKNY